MSAQRTRSAEKQGEEKRARPLRQRGPSHQCSHRGTSGYKWREFGSHEPCRGSWQHRQALPAPRGYNERRDPPVYRMMSSQDILAIQMDKRAKDKAKTKTGTFCTKELRFTSMTEKSHLGVKQNQLVRWLQKGPCHIRITITRGNKSTSVEDVKACLDEFLHPLLEDSVTFVSKPRPVQNERALLCIIRKMTDKEMSQNRKLQSAEQPSSRTPAMKGSGLVRNQTQEIDQNSSNSLTYQYGFKDEK
uniref:translation initiation factor IF-3, mitochondrial-like isoform X2 n=1 Tax=Myxine glutinosa TaxID=7769 RepID=UPI00358E0C33